MKTKLLRWTFWVGLPTVTNIRRRTVTVRAATHEDACLRARVELDRRAAKRDEEPPCAWQLDLKEVDHSVACMTTRLLSGDPNCPACGDRRPTERKRSMKTDTDRAITYAIKTFGREPPRGKDVEEVLAMLTAVRREEEQKLAGHEYAPGQTPAKDDEMRAVSYVCRRMPKAFPNGWLVDDLVAVFRVVRRDARRKHERRERERAA